MRGRTGLQLLHCLGLVSGLVCLLAGCSGSSSSDDPRGAGGRVGQLSLQLVLAPPPASPASPAGAGAAQGRQGQPGEPGFLERIEVRLQAGGQELAPPQVFALAPTEQETVTRTVTVPDTVPATFTVLVASLNNQGLAVFRGTVTVTREQTSAVVTLGRAALVPVPATPANLAQTTFQFDEGTAFGLGTTPVTLAVGTFEDNVGDFALLARGVVASGHVVIASCTFLVTTSAFPTGQGPQVGDSIVIDPCQVDAIDHRLIATNVTLSATPATSTSSPPVPAPPEGSLNLPAVPPLLVLPEDSSGTVQINAAVGGGRPATTTFALTAAPAQGTATVTPSGLVTYQPAADFHGSDRLVVTVIVSFADNALPPLLLGTVPVTLTVQPVNDAPTVTNPGAQSTAEGTAVSLALGARDVDNDRLTFSATGLPPGLSLDPTTGGIGGTIAALAASGSPYSVTVTVTDGTANASTTFSWIIPQVTPVNTAPVPTAPALSTLQETAGSSQVSPNDPNTSQTHTYSVSTPPAQGSATVSASGLATYTPAMGFSGTDSFVVTVTDNGTPPLTGAVTIPVTVVAAPNRPPVPTAPSISTEQNTAGSSQVSPNDPNTSQTHTYSVSTPPAQGSATVSASGLATYTPAVGFSGADSFVVTVTDNGTPPLPGMVTIPVTVQPNRAPSPTAPAINTSQNTAGSSQVSPNDPDTSQTHTYSVSTPPARGSATVSASGLATYTPTAGSSGADSFVVTVTDNGTPPLTGMVTISVTVQPNQAPAPTAPAISTSPNTPGSSQVSANDPDASQTHTYSVSTPPAQGSATVSASGLATYTPTPGSSGADSFVVTVTDNGTPPLTGMVTIPVTVQPNQAPAPTAPAISTSPNTPGSSQVSANDPDASQTHTYSVSTPPAQGSATVSASGLATYTPASGFIGADSFMVTVLDNGTPPLAGTVTIAVTVQALSPTLFGTDANGGNLLTIDPATGTGTIVGSMGVGAVPALAIDPTTGTMYTATGSGDPSLYRVDPATGATTLIGSTGLGVAAVGDLTFRADGTLYAAVNILGDGGTGSDNLAIIDKTTGEAEVIGPFGTCTTTSCTIEGMEAIVFDTSGTLLGALSERGAAGMPGLYQIDSITGTATFFVPILDGIGAPSSGGVVSLQFCDGTLFGGTARAIAASGTDGGRLISIDPVTGLFTFVGSGSATGGSSLGALACRTRPPRTDLQLWLRADLGVTVDAADGVSAWADQSGAGHHASQGDPSLRPLLISHVLNGLPVLRFNGHNNALLIAGQVLTSQQYTIVAVVNDTRVSSEGEPREMFSNWSSTNMMTSVFLGTINTNPLRARLTDDFGGATDAAHPQQGVGAIVNPTQHFIFTGISGATDALVFQGNNLLAAKGSAISLRDLASSPYNIGTQGGFEFWQGDIAELLVYNRELSPDELQEVWNYLQQKYF